MSNQNPQHYYMATVLIIYERDGAPKQKHMNMVIQVPRKLLTTSSLNNVRMTALQRLAEETGVTAEDVRDLIFLGFTYLGNAKPADFYDMETAAPKIPN